MIEEIVIEEIVIIEESMKKDNYQEMEFVEAGDSSVDLFERFKISLKVKSLLKSVKETFENIFLPISSPFLYEFSFRVSSPSWNPRE